MTTDNSNDEHFLEGFNRRLLGNDYESFLASSEEKQRKLLHRPTKTNRHRWLYFFAGAAATLLFTIWCIFSWKDDRVTNADIGLLSLLDQANAPLSTGDGTVFDPSRGTSVQPGENLLQSAKTAYEAKDYQNALSFFQALVRENKDEHRYLLFLGSCYAQLKQYGSANEIYAALLSATESKNADLAYEARFHLGVNQILAGHLAEAKATLRPLENKGWHQETVRKLIEKL